MATAETIATDAAALRRSHPHAPALDALDLVMQGADGLAIAAGLVHPRGPLGQLLAEAFDTAMTPADWHDWTGPQADPQARDALLAIWRTYVLPRFVSRYSVNIA